MPWPASMPPSSAAWSSSRWPWPSHCSWRRCSCPPPRFLAAALALLAAVVERWLFFAEAQHVVTLFYGAKAA